MTTSWKTWFLRLLLVVLFMLVLTYVLFLANGYQYDFWGNQIRRTGIVEITYNDPQARVYLDGQQLEGTLPFSASNVLPGKYHLVVGREEYWDYSLDIVVEEDLISRITTVFLLPMDLLSRSKLLADLSAVKSNQAFLSAGHVWRQSEDGSLWFAGLSPVIEAESFKKVNVPAVTAKVKDVDFIGKEYLLSYEDGQRYLLDPLTGKTDKIYLSENYLPAAGKWIYFKDNVLSAMSRDFDRVLWARQPQIQERITAVRYYFLEGREFLAVDYAGREYQGQLFELKADRLWPIDQGNIDSVTLDDRGDPVYVKEGREIWQYDSLEKQTVQLARFMNSVEIISAVPNIYRSEGLFLFRMKDNYLLSDRYFKNVRTLFNFPGILSADLSDGKKLYFIKNSSDQALPNRMELFMYNLEN